MTLDGVPQEGLDELECVDGDIYANVFLTTDILPIDASGLPNNAEPSPHHVLNGIAHVFGADWFLLGGKRWPDLYEVELIPTQ